ncbi:MAG TPA: hypothetical protein VJ650_09615 [Gemmatimonadaceae bacterium]|nr:hypothetical protein [Gemmatimonadaceae bacterium]
MDSRLAVLSVALLAASGCYVNRPLDAAPEPGTTVVMAVNDRGRVALADSVGESVAQIEGALVSRRDSVFVVRVRAVEFLNGQRHRWTGEPLTIREEHLRDVHARRMSRGRTAVVAGVISSSVIAFILSRDLFGLGGGGREPGGGGGPGPDQ